MDNVYLVAAAWVAVALAASLISIRLGVSVALIEIALGVFGGNVFRLQTAPWIDALAAFGSVLLTFLAGAEIDPASLRRHLGKSLALGGLSFALPAIAAFVFATVGGWELHAAEIAGIALSTTSVAVVYAVMIESGLANEEIGKLILAACFVTDLGTVLALGVLFADFNVLLMLFLIATALGLAILPRLLRWLLRAVPDRVSKPEIKFVLLTLLALGGLAAAARSEAVLPAYLIGLAFAGAVVHDRVLVHRDASHRLLAAHAVLFHQGRPACVPAGGAGRCRPDRCLPAHQGRVQGDRRVARRSPPGPPPAGSQLHDSLDVHGPDVWLDLSSLRVDQRSDRPGAVRSAGYHRDSFGRRTNPDRYDLLRAAHPRHWRA